MDEKFIAHALAELIDAQQQALAVLAGAVGDAFGREALSTALDARAAKAQAATHHPMRDKLLATAMRALKAK